MTAGTPILDLRRTSVTMPFEIHSMDWIGRNRWEQNAVPHRHNYFVIVWVKEGSGIHLIDLDKYELRGNTVYCISPGQIHLLTAKGPVDGYVISFTTEFMGPGAEDFELLFQTGLFKNFSPATVISVAPDLQKEMEDVAAAMTKEFSNFFLLRSEILRGYLRIFLVYLTRQFEKTKSSESHSRNAELVRQFFSLVEKRFAAKHMVNDFAEEMVVTPNYLNEVVKKVTGLPASHHIQQRIILEAKRLAAYTQVTMKEVAYQLGFDDTAHFSKFFKNAAGRSFTDFRKEYDRRESDGL